MMFGFDRQVAASVHLQAPPFDQQPLLHPGLAPAALLYSLNLHCQEEAQAFDTLACSSPGEGTWCSTRTSESGTELLSSPLSCFL